MDPNPYEPPRDGEPAPVLREGSADETVFAFLALAIFAGLATIFPWPGIVFLLGSSPLFLRYWTLRRRARGNTPPGWPERLSLACGASGVVAGIVAAALGAFYGTCNVGVWVSAAALWFRAETHQAARRDEDAMYELLQWSFAIGVICGVVGGAIAFIWLVQWWQRVNAETRS